MRDNVGEPWQINDINSTEYGTESWIEHRIAEGAVLEN
jgi:hypothetical protein